jgi:hypothetical protein
MQSENTTWILLLVCFTWSFYRLVAPGTYLYFCHLLYRDNCGPVQMGAKLDRRTCLSNIPAGKWTLVRPWIQPCSPWQVLPTQGARVTLKSGQRPSTPVFHQNSHCVQPCPQSPTPNRALDPQ